MFAFRHEFEISSYQSIQEFYVENETLLGDPLPTGLRVEGGIIKASAFA